MKLTHKKAVGKRKQLNLWISFAAIARLDKQRGKLSRGLYIESLFGKDLSVKSKLSFVEQKVYPGDLKRLPPKPAGLTDEEWAFECSL